MKIQPSTASDVPLILALIRELAEAEKLSFEITVRVSKVHGIKPGG